MEKDSFTVSLHSLQFVFLLSGLELSVASENGRNSHCSKGIPTSHMRLQPGIILGMGSANERWHYNATSVIGWAHTQNDPWQCIAAYLECTGHVGITSLYLHQPITEAMTPARITPANHRPWLILHWQSYRLYNSLHYRLCNSLTMWWLRQSCLVLYLWDFDPQFAEEITTKISLS